MSNRNTQLLAGFAALLALGSIGYFAFQAPDRASLPSTRGSTSPSRTDGDESLPSSNTLTDSVTDPETASVGRESVAPPLDSDTGQPTPMDEELVALWDFEAPTQDDPVRSVQPAPEYLLDHFRPVYPAWWYEELGGPPASLDEVHALVIRLARTPGQMGHSFANGVRGPAPFSRKVLHQDSSATAELIELVSGIEDDYRARVELLANTLDSLIQDDYGRFLDQREYVVFQRGERPPPSPERSIYTIGRYFNFDPWFVDASYDPLLHTGIASTLEEIEDAKARRKEALAPLKKLYDQ